MYAHITFFMLFRPWNSTDVYGTQRLARLQVTRRNSTQLDAFGAKCSKNRNGCIFIYTANRACVGSSCCSIVVFRFEWTSLFEAGFAPAGGFRGFVWNFPPQTHLVQIVSGGHVPIWIPPWIRPWESPLELTPGKRFLCSRVSVNAPSLGTHAGVVWNCLTKGEAAPKVRSMAQLRWWNIVLTVFFRAKKKKMHGKNT